MNPLSIVRHLVLLVLVYAALVAETTIVPALDLGGPTIRPLWIVLALVVGRCQGNSVLVYAALLGLTSDCLRGNGPLGLDLVLATVAAKLLTTARPGRPAPSIASVTLTTLILTTSIQTVSILVRNTTGPLDSNWLLATLPTTLAAATADALANSALVLASLILLRTIQQPIAKLLLPTPLTN
jgi:cell shape-determining protein MreD